MKIYLFRKKFKNNLMCCLFEATKHIVKRHIFKLQQRDQDAD